MGSILNSTLGAMGAIALGAKQIKPAAAEVIANKAEGISEAGSNLKAESNAAFKEMERSKDVADLIAKTGPVPENLKNSINEKFKEGNLKAEEGAKLEGKSKAMFAKAAILSGNYNSAAMYYAQSVLNNEVSAKEETDKKVRFRGGKF